MRTLHGFTVGDIVIVNDDLTITKNNYNLDGSGNMKRMRRMSFPIIDLCISSSGNKYATLKCPDTDYSYHFDLQDLTLLNNIEEEQLKDKPPEFFDPQNLVRQ